MTNMFTPMSHQKPINAQEFIINTILLTLGQSDMCQPSKGHLKGVRQIHFNCKFNEMGYLM
jgi:hypothetical protein